MEGRTYLSLPIWLHIAGVALAIAVGAVMAEVFGLLFSLGLTGAVAGMMTGLLLLGRGEPVPDRDDFDARGGWDALHREIRRSRRYGRPFVLVGTPGDQHTAAALQSMLRTPDRAWIDGAIVYTLLTECDRVQAFGFIERARAGVPSLFEADQFRLASFPSDAVTVGALLEALQPEAVLVPHPALPTVGAVLEALQPASDTPRVTQTSGPTREVA
jgi:hypothetical protein